MSFFSRGDFIEYKPQWQTQLEKELLARTAPRKIFYSTVDKNGNALVLNENQKTTIQTILNEQIRINPRKHHKMRITVLEEDKFRIVLDGRYRFFISKKMVEELKDTPEYIVIQDKITNRSLLKRFKEFWRMVFNVFYKPTFPDPGLKKRSYREAVAQDYRALRRSLESGHAWLMGGKKIKISSTARKERGALHEAVNQTISHAKKIEKALGKTDQKRALDGLAESFSNTIISLRDKETLSIPTGYLNQEGALQPVMLRFSRKGMVFSCEFYNDAVEGTVKLPPTVVKEFNIETAGRDEFKKVISSALSPLIEKKLEEKKLREVAKPSETFGVLFEQKVEEAMTALEAEYGVEQKVEEVMTALEAEFGVVAEEKRVLKPVGSLTYESFLRSIEGKMGDNWRDVIIPEKKLARQPGTPAARVAKWFTSLVGEENKFSRNEKLNLLYHLTNEWLDDKFRQIARRKSAPEKLEAYKECLSHIQHVKEKLAIAINEGHSLDPEMGIPESLIEREKVCSVRIDQLQLEIRKQTIEITGNFLNKAQTADLSIKFPKMTIEPPAEVAVAKGAAPIAAIDREVWRRDLSGLSQLLSEEGLRKQQAQQVVVQLDQALRVVKEKLQGELDTQRAAVKLPDPAKIEQLEGKIAFLENADTILESVFPQSGKEYNPKSLKNLLNILIVDTGFGDQVTKDGSNVGAYTIGKFNASELSDVLLQLIMCPHLIPTYSSDKGDVNGDLIRFLRAVQDPQTTVDPHLRDAYQSLRALINLRLLVPKETALGVFEENVNAHAVVNKQHSLMGLQKELKKNIKEAEEGLERVLKIVETAKASGNQASIEMAEASAFSYSLKANLSKDRLKEFSSDPTLEKQIEVLTSWNRKLDVEKNEEGVTKREQGFVKQLMKENTDAITILEGRIKYQKFLEANRSPESMRFMSTSIGEVPKVDLKEARSVGGIKAFNAALAAQVTQLTQQVNSQKIAAAAERDLVRKRALLEEVKQNAYQVLKMLPLPGTEGVSGVPSVWYQLSKEERQTLLKDIHELEHTAWEAQMKLAQSELGGKEKFLLVKAQAIRQAIIRAEVEETQKKFEKIFETLWVTDKKLVESFDFISPNKETGRLEYKWYKVSVASTRLLDELMGKKIQESKEILNVLNERAEEETLENPSKIMQSQISGLVKLVYQQSKKQTFVSEREAISWDAEKGKLDINWDPPGLNADDWKNIRAVIVGSENLLSEEAVPNAGYLFFDTVTMDTVMFNQLLAQDLTACLSENAEMEQDLMSVYHFVVHDQNRGRSDKINLLRGSDLQREYTQGRARRPLFISAGEDSGFVFIEGPKNKTAIYDKEELDKTIQNETMREEIYTLLDQLEKGTYYYETASDPDFTLYSAKPSIGVTYFQSNPDTLMSQDRLDLKVVRKGIAVVGEGDVKLAEVVTEGDGKYVYIPGQEEEYSEEEAEARIKAKKSFLPVVDNETIEERPIINDLRTHKTFEVWMEYVAERAQEETLSIPPQALLQLFQIRQAPADGRNRMTISSYDADTAVRALSFMTNGNNQRYMQLDFVQQYLEESLFGSFVLQQAVVEFPEEIAEQLKLLQARYIEAKAAGNFEVAGYLANVLTQVGSHLKFTHQQIAAHGWFAGVINGSLPIHMDKVGGYFHYLFVSTKMRDGGNEYTVPFGAKETEDADPNQVIQPLGMLTQRIRECAELAASINKEIHTGHNLLGYYFSGEKGKRTIDAIKNREMKRQVYTHALENYRLNPHVEPKERDIEEILNGYLLITDSDIEGGIRSQRHDLIEWVRGSIIPKFNALPESQRNGILTTLLNQELARHKLKEVVKANWKGVANEPFKYVLETPEKTYSIDLLTTRISGAGVEQKGAAVFIPDDILKRAEVQQALKKDKIQAEKNIRPGGVTEYRWKENGQNFSIIDRNGHLTINREITEGDYKGKYVFHPIAIGGVTTQVEELLSGNGMWIRNEDIGRDEITSYLFSVGTNVPMVSDTYLASCSTAETGETVINKVLKGQALDRFVSASETMETTSPVLFANSKNVMTIIDQNRLEPAQILLKGIDLNLKREGNEWECYQGTTLLGTIKYPENEKTLIEAFGVNWDQYVIPIEKEVVVHTYEKGVDYPSHKNVTQYVMLPYKQSVDGKGKLSVDHDSLNQVAHPEIMTIGADGLVHGSIAAELYLANRSILQAAQTKNTTEARRLYGEAQKHLQRIANERPPTDTHEIENLKNVLNLIKNYPAVSPEGAPAPEALALALRLGLAVRKMRKLSADQDVKTLTLSASDNFKEMEATTKLFEAYSLMENAKQYALFIPKKETLAKGLLKLNEVEKTELAGIGLQVLHDVRTQIVEQTAGAYFGTTGRLVTALTMEQPTAISPDFFLTLLRGAKPADPAIDIRDITSPIPLHQLMENFWSYFLSIKTHGIGPDKLTFLFEPSLIPPSKTPEEEASLKEIDKQARQFLLALAGVQKEFGGEVDPLKMAQEAIDKAKIEMKGLTAKGSSFAEVKEYLAPDVQRQFNLLIESVGELKVTPISKQIGKKSLTYPDVGALARSAQEISTRATNFSESLSDQVSQAETLIREHTAGANKLNEGLFKLEREVRSTEKSLKEELDILEEKFVGTELEAQRALLGTKYREEMGVLEEKLVKAQREIRSYEGTMVKDPITGNDIPGMMITSGEYASRINLEKLQQAARTAEAFKADLKKELEGIDDMTTQMNLWLQMEEITMQLSEAQFTPSSWFQLPEKGAAKAFIQNVLTGTGQAGGIIIAGLSLIKEIGIYRSAKLGMDMKRSSQLQERITAVPSLQAQGISEEESARLKEELSDLQQEFNSTLLGKVELFAKPLGAFIVAAKLQRQKKPITVEGARRGVEKPFLLQSIKDNSVAQKCFTTEQLNALDEKLITMDPKKQKSVLAQLSAALERTETIIATQTSLERNTADLNRIYDSRFGEGAPLPPPMSPPNLRELRKKHDFDTRYSPSYGIPIDLSFHLGKLLDSHSRTFDMSHLKFMMQQLQALTFETFIEEVEEDDEVEVKMTKIELKRSPEEIEQGLAMLRDHLSATEFQPMIDMLRVVALANVDPVESDRGALSLFFSELNKIKHGNQFIEKLKAVYKQVAPSFYKKEHERFVETLKAKTLPDEQDSLYSQDLKKGFDTLTDHNPLPYADVVKSSAVENIETVIRQHTKEIEASIDTQKKTILEKLKSLSLSTLPQELQRIRLRQGSDEELLNETLKVYRKGAFSKMDELDILIGAYQIDQTRLGALQGARHNAMDSVQELYKLREQKDKIIEELKRLEGKNIQHGDGFDFMKIEVAARYGAAEGAMEIFSPNYIESLKNQLKAIDSKWNRESSKIRDLTSRSQDTSVLENLSPELKPHARKIIYLQNRLGIVLRKNQLDTLTEIIKNPSLLAALRMGLGKTSTIIPFILEILASLGYNPIGMVPRALFDTNFKEMDETTRVVFELAGNQFLFNRQDAPQPFSLPVLQKISQKCADFLAAFERREFVLTTIESKASIDDKINEIERSQARINEEIARLTIADKDQNEKQIKALYDRVAEHQMALDNLYRVKAVFEHPKTRLIIDEADQVARAKYSVNSEIGVKEAPDPLLRDTISKIFDMIRDEYRLDELRLQIFNNYQFTLTKEEVDRHLFLIGRIWLEENKHKLPLKWSEDLGGILNWFTGGDSPFTRADLAQLDASFVSQLQAMRRGLNSSLRGALGLKIGLSGEYDPTHFAVGVPASQGITSKTTKYSDPMMQLSLTHLIAMNKPQGEEFLKSVASDVMEQLQKKFSEHKIRFEEIGDSPKTHGEGLERQRLVREMVLMEQGIERISTLVSRQKEGKNPPVYSKELEGNDTLTVFLRQQFGEQVALRKLIYVSENQLSRPVQHTLRGCHVIGLTGTATRNTEHVINSAGFKKGMDSIEKTGRDSTAEVIYRLAKALPNGLDTPIGTYSLDSNEVLKQFKSFAKKGSGYNFLVNQAGACDKLKLHDIVRELHASEGRPIVFMNIDKEGKSCKSVLIDGNIVALDRLTHEQKLKVRTEGFFYYHTPHVRGTHFDIPTGSKGALMLSPTVNANDRDQAAYRARELGEGHIVEPFISGKQSAELKGRYQTNVVTLSHVLKEQHNRTQFDEGKEDLSAYQLHIQGQLVLGADKIMEKLQLATPAGKFGDLFDPQQRETYQAQFAAKSAVFEKLEKFFVQDSGNKSYQRLLEREIYQGGEAATKLYLENMIRSEIKKAVTLLKVLHEEHAKAQGNMPLQNAFSVAIKEIENAAEQLKLESDALIANWARIEKQYPKTASAAPSAEETAETEAEEEAQEEQETTSETAAELQKKRRNAATKSILTTLDEKMLNAITPDFTWSYLTDRYHRFLGDTDAARGLAPTEGGWSRSINITKRLVRALKGTIGGALPDIKLIVVRKGDHNMITAAEGHEGNLATGSKANFMRPSEVVGGPEELANAFTLQPTFNSKGELQFIYTGAAPMTKGLKEAWKTDTSLVANAILTMMYLGVTQIGEENWRTLEAYWQQRPPQERKLIQAKFEEQVGKKNPGFLEKIGRKLWNKSVE